MPIVLFHPRGRAHVRGVTDIHGLACVMAPIGLASIAAVLRKAGHEVHILDATLATEVPNSVWVSKIVALRPEWVGISATTSGFLDAYNVCARLKQADARIKTVFGGVHVSWGKQRILRDYPAIDYVVVGEGEIAMQRLVGGDAPATIEGLCYRNGVDTSQGPPLTTLCEMDDLPFPAYDLLEGFPDKYLMPLFSYPQHPGANIVSSRGCVYQCTFCDRSVFGKSFRWNSAQYTFEQIKWLGRDFGVKHVMFYDDLFTLNRKRVAELCQRLHCSKLGVTFNCIVRVGHVDEDLIKLLKMGGCWMVNVGIESGDQRILDAHKEGLNLETIRRDVQKLHEAGLWIKGLFMMGFPGETEQSVIRTREFAFSLPLKDANVTAFTPFPGAPISPSIEQLGWFDNDWSKMDCEQFVFVPHEAPAKEAMERHRKDFIKGFYQRPAMRAVYRKLLFQSPHSFLRLARSAPLFLRYARRM